MNALASPTRPSDVTFWTRVRGELLSTRERRGIIDGLIASMPSYGVRQYFEVKGTIFDEYDVLVVAESFTSQRPVAMLAAHWLDAAPPRFLHIQTILIGEAWHRTSTIREMWRELFEELLVRAGGFPQNIVLKTYNPKSLAAMTAFAAIRGTAMFPALRGESLRPELIEAVKRIAECLSPGCPLDTQTGVLKGGAGGIDFYRSLPFVGKHWIYEHFRRHVTPSDRVLCCLFIETTDARSRVLRGFGVERKIA